jgi:predicted flap endonuclease-1-like 5' DNA nuclease
MSDIVPTRVHFFEHQFLRAVDFTAEQAYHLQGLRRHNLAGHRWGIIYGLEVVVDEGGNLSVQAGVAVDGYGRTLILPVYRSISPEVFQDQASDTLQVWLLYDRQPGEAAPGGYAACDADGAVYREVETARVSVRAPDPNQVSAGGADIPDGRRPLDVAPEDLDFGPTRTPVDDPAQPWPVYLGLVERTADGTLRVDLEGRPYAGLVGEFVRSPSGKALLQVGAERVDDPNRFAVYLDPDEEPPSPLPLPGKLPDLAIEENGEIKIYHDTTLYGDLTVDGGAVILEGGPEYDAAQPWRFYHTVADSETSPGVQIEQLRVEMAPQGSPGEVVIGHWSAQKKKFVPCLTVDNDCLVTVHGSLEVQGSMDVKGSIISAEKTAAMYVQAMHIELESGHTPAMNALVGELQAPANQAVLAALLARLVPIENGGDLLFSVLRAAGVENMEGREGMTRPPHPAGTPRPEATERPDDLTRLPGIGPTFARRFRDAGVRRFEGVARMSDDEISETLQLRPFQKLDYEAVRRQAAEYGTGREGAGGPAAEGEG